MNVDLIVVGRTDSEPVGRIVEEYMRRINFYVKFSIVTLPGLRNTRNMPPAAQKKEEGEAILKQISAGDHVVLLDEKGASGTSRVFAAWLQKRFNGGCRRLVFVIGGPYGFSEAVYSRADEKISLSAMTFSHQIIRVVFVEQLYRAFTIINNEPYHHD